MSWTTLVFITFYVEINLGLKFWFELVVFQKFKFERFKFGQMTRSQILVRTCRFSKFQIWKVQILSNDKMTKIKVVDNNELNNFSIHHFLCWNHFGSQILVWTCHFFKISNLKGSNFVKWQDDQNKSCRS